MRSHSNLLVASALWSRQCREVHSYQHVLAVGDFDDVAEWSRVEQVSHGRRPRYVTNDQLVPRRSLRLSHLGHYCLKPQRYQSLGLAFDQQFIVFVDHPGQGKAVFSHVGSSSPISRPHAAGFSKWTLGWNGFVLLSNGDFDSRNSSTSITDNRWL